MARIPVYQERQQVNQLVPVSQLSAPDTGAGLIGRSLQQVGQALGQVSQAAIQIEQENGKAYAMKASGQAKLDMTQHFLKMQETAAPGASGFTTKFDSEFQAYANGLLKEAPEGPSRRFLASSLEQLRESLLSQSLMYEVTEGRANRVNDVRLGINATSDTLFKNPSQQEYEKSVGEASALIDSMDLLPEQRRRLNEEMRERYSTATVDGQIKINPSAFLDSVSGATGRNVDRKKLTKAQISVESGGDPNAVGPETRFGRAIGLMQVLPSTAAEPGFGLPSIFVFAKSKNITYAGPTLEEAERLLKNPEINEQYGEMYMDAMIENYDGNLVYALAGYNWGPRNTNRWIADGANFNQLPKETREYIPKVLSKAGVNIKLDGNAATTGNAAFDNLSFEKQMQYIDRANVRVKQQQAEYRVQFENQLSDANAMAMNGIVNPNTLTLDNFVSAYGEEKGLQNFQLYRDNQTMAADIGMLKTMPLDRMSEKVEAYKPEPGEGFELKQKRYDIMRQSAARVIQMRNDDPVRYSQDTNPDVKESYDYYQTISADPAASTKTIGAATQDYVSKSIAEQRRLGVAEPKVLSNVELDNLSRRISAGNENAANLVLSIEAMYGANYYPQVMDELLTAGKLSNAMVVIADLPNAGARESVARIANIPRANLEAGINAVDIKDIKLNTTAVVQELRASAGPVTDQTAKSLAAYQDIIERQALEYIGTGAASNASNAVDMAKKLYLGHYQFDGTLRMPANMDSDYITDGLERSLDNVYNSLTIVDVPQDLTRAYNANEALELWKTDIDNNHFWVADNKTEGAFLWVRTENGMSYKVLQGGEQVYLRYSDMVAERIERDERATAEFRRLMLGK
jgi:hypothetical protein